MSLSWPSKSTGEVIFYGLNWSQPLGTDTIATSSWALSATDIVEDSSSFWPYGTTILLSGGTANTTYTVTNTITTASGQTFVEPVSIRVTTP